MKPKAKKDFAGKRLRRKKTSQEKDFARKGGEGFFRALGALPSGCKLKNVNVKGKLNYCCRKKSP